MRKGTFKMHERGCQMRHFRAIAQDLAALMTSDQLRKIHTCLIWVFLKKKSLSKKDFLMFGYEPDLYFEMAMKQWNKCLLGGIEEPSGTGMISFKLIFKSVPEGRYLPVYHHTRERWLKLPPSKSLLKLKKSSFLENLSFDFTPYGERKSCTYFYPRRQKN